MTLALASLTPTCAVVTLDGRSTRINAGVVTIDDQYQKIVLVPASRLAVYQHGQNEMGGKDWKALITPHFATLANCQTTGKARDALHAQVDAEIRAQLLSMTDAQCGLVVIGFGRGDREPSACESLWREKQGGIVVEQEQTLPIGVHTSGDGAKHIKPRSWQEIKGKNSEQIRQIHKSIMEAAILAEPAATNCVGGRVHEVRIVSHFEWTLPP